MKKRLLVGLVTGLFLAGMVGVASATLVGYVNNPSSNSTDWTAAVNGTGGTINSNVNFDGMSTGSLNNNFYQISDGVVLSTSGDFNGVFNGAGPGQGNTSSNNSGEGIHSASNYLNGGSGLWSLTVSFDEAVSGFGLDVIDFFGYGSWESLTLEAFTGSNGSGTSLGSFSALQKNYQMNYTYFMGLLSDNDDIMSIVFTDFNGNTGDILGIDNLQFSRNGNAPVPEPATMLLFGTGLAGLVGLRRRKNKK